MDGVTAMKTKRAPNTSHSSSKRSQQLERKWRKWQKRKEELLVYEKLIAELERQSALGEIP